MATRKCNSRSTPLPPHTTHTHTHSPLSAGYCSAAAEQQVVQGNSNVCADLGCLALHCMRLRWHITQKSLALTLAHVRLQLGQADTHTMLVFIWFASSCSCHTELQLALKALCFAMEAVCVCAYSWLQSVCLEWLVMSTTQLWQHVSGSTCGLRGKLWLNTMTLLQLLLHRDSRRLCTGHGSNCNTAEPVAAAVGFRFRECTCSCSIS